MERRPVKKKAFQRGALAKGFEVGRAVDESAAEREIDGRVAGQVARESVGAEIHPHSAGPKGLSVVAGLAHGPMQGGAPEQIRPGQGRAHEQGELWIVSRPVPGGGSRGGIDGLGVGAMGQEQPGALDGGALGAKVQAA